MVRSKPRRNASSSETRGNHRSNGCLTVIHPAWRDHVNEWIVLPFHLHLSSKESAFGKSSFLYCLLHKKFPCVLHSNISLNFFKQPLSLSPSDIKRNEFPRNIKWNYKVICVGCTPPYF